MQTDVAIIGGGLSGLALADILHRNQINFQLLEARPRFGGRILTATTQSTMFDLGPSWFWPGQPRMAEMVGRFELSVFAQYANGMQLYQDETGAVHHAPGAASMRGSLRLDGGMQTIINGLVAGLPANQLHLGCAVCKVGLDGTLHTTDGETFATKQVVMCLPPRVAAEIEFDPPASKYDLQLFKNIPTWMGGHAKAVAVFDHPFWRDAGLSGDAVSRIGPLAEIHDASGPNGTPAALFGFIGVPAAQRPARAADLKDAILAQLVQIFGPMAATPIAFHVQDWALEPETSAPLDQNPPTHHPRYRMPHDLNQAFGNKIHFSGAELANDMGGYLEGALNAAHGTAQTILHGL